MSDGVAALQREFTRHIRDPGASPCPDGVESRRMRIYNELVYNTIESFVAGGFPVLRSLFDDREWHQLIRRFVSSHRCRTPYFLEIGQEFLRFIEAAPDSAGTRRPFLLELAHYEWVEIALDVADAEIAAPGIDPGGDPMTGIPVLSPLAWPLSYRFAVHLIGRDFQPPQPGPDPTCLIVYRNAADAVKFIESNAVTLRMLALMDGEQSSGEAICGTIAGELGVAPAQLFESCRDTLLRLQALGVVAGTRSAGRYPTD